MGDVIQYRDFDKPAKRWSNMEHFNRFKKAGQIPVADTAPCEYVNPEPFETAAHYRREAIVRNGGFVAPDQDAG